MTEEVSGAAIIVVIVIGVIVGVGLVWALLKASEKPDPALVVTSLSLITMAALVGYGLTKLEILGGLAATGIGALAGAVTGLYRRPTDPTDRADLPDQPTDE